MFVTLRDASTADVEQARMVCVVPCIGPGLGGRTCYNFGGFAVGYGSDRLRVRHWITGVRTGDAKCP